MSTPNKGGAADWVNQPLRVVTSPHNGTHENVKIYDRRGRIVHDDNVVAVIHQRDSAGCGVEFASAVKLPRPYADRNAWLYDQYKNTGKKMAAIKKEAKDHTWTVDSDSHFYQCIDNHATDNGLQIYRRNHNKRIGS